MIRIETVTARRLAQAGLGPRETAAALRSITRLPFGIRRRTELRRLEEATGGMMQISYPGGTVSSIDTCIHPDLDRSLVFSSVALDEDNDWEADSLCASRDGIPETILQGVDGATLRSVVDHPDLPDATIVSDKQVRPEHALLTVDAVSFEELPEPTLRDRIRHRRAMRRFVGVERRANTDRAIRIAWARNGFLLLGSIAALWWLAMLANGHGFGIFQIVCATTVTAMPFLTAWNVYEANPAMHRWLSLPAIEAEHRRQVESRHRARIGMRGRLDWLRQR